MFNEYNVCGVDYDLFHIFEEKNNRVFFPEWLLPAFEYYCDEQSNVKYHSENDIRQEDNDMLSVPALYDAVSNFLGFFHAQNWYSELEEIGATPKSKLYLLDAAEIQNITKSGSLSSELMHKVQTENPNKHFYRLNSLSSKYEGYMTLDEAIDHISSSERTLATLKRPIVHYLFVRDWVNCWEYVQYRCFVLNNTLKGVSIYDHQRLNKPLPKQKLIEFVQKVMKSLDFYQDCTLDIAIHISDLSMFVIEVNSPVYGFAGSAMFTPVEIERVLMNKCEGIDYPVFR